ncbi:MAG: carbamoyltransferase HypF [Deltaproteobacteria bacterium GWC2_42_11]|nr:MAG: carbamoyltransferase HypF [Deltaproteobacteria bacterium GWC2_42_11]HBO84812.1 carbamoyltransferase HypF [Deltaproteobacteria bacterium]
MSAIYRIHINGIVQGIGFRPFIYNLANSFELNGYVLNDTNGVYIEVKGNEDRIREFIQRIKSDAPPLARFDDVSIEKPDYKDYTGIYSGFEIRESRSTHGIPSVISPDISLCDDCLKELFDKNNRRYLYPFINCTNCGPRHSIVRDIPYDRINTTMSCFEMCEECRREYNDPSDRRFHAQPNACPECGPRLEFRIDKKNPPSPPFLKGGTKGEFSEQKEKPIKTTISILKQGGIAAIKGIGGFHLACDAENNNAVKRLRDSKRRSNKPFAVMMPDIETIRQFCYLTKDEDLVLNSPARPIVLLKKKHNISISDSVSPENNYLGAMLPYTPLHYLLFYYPLTHDPQPITPNFKALVMTSGNIFEEPIAADNKEAVQKLSSIADAFLMHNRDIYMRVDDSVVNVISGQQLVINSQHNSKLKTLNSKLVIIRRSRGFVPEPIYMGQDMPEILACGGQLKNTFCLTKGRYAIMSQHIGDMENKEAAEFYKETLKNLKKTFKVMPKIIAHDLHPNYWTTAFARQLITHHSSLISIPVQHHHAHIVSCMAEHGLKEKVIGIAFDGTGYGTDGNIWGGEFLIADRKDFIRFAHFNYVPMPGSDAAARKPWRMGLSHLVHTYGDGAKELIHKIFSDRIQENQLNTILKMMKNSINSPLTSSCGRFFDAVSSLIGAKDLATYEGEAAVKLEMLAETKCYDTYNFNITDGFPLVVCTKQIIKEIIDDAKANLPVSVISAKFHNTIAETILTAAQMVQKKHNLDKVVLSGGVFQNSFLVKRTAEKLTVSGFEVFLNEKVPSNDGGISLGQAVIAAEHF